MYQKMYGGHWDVDWIAWCFAYYDDCEAHNLSTGFIGTI